MLSSYGDVEVYSNTTRARTASGDGGGSTRAKEEGVGSDLDFVLVLDMVDALGESVEPPATRFDPVQVAGIYGTRSNPAIRVVYVPVAHLEFASGVNGHPAKFARLSQFAQTPNGSLE